MAAMWPQMLLVVALFVVATQAQTIIQGPVDTAALYNTQSQLNCTVDNLGNDPLEWRLFSNASALGGTRVYVSSDLSQTAPGYRVDTSSPGAYNLIIENTLPHNTGTYRCSLLGAGTSVDAEFIGVEAPECNNNTPKEMMVGTYVTLTCTVASHGAILPTLTWLDDYGANVAVSTYASSNGRFIAVWVFIVEAFMDEVPFECVLNFDPSPPAYTDSCTTSFSVLSPTRPMSTTAKQGLPTP